MIEKKYIITLLLIFSTSFCINLLFVPATYVWCSLIFIAFGIYHIFKHDRHLINREKTIKNKISAYESAEKREIEFEKLQVIIAKETESFEPGIKKHYKFALYSILIGIIIFFSLNINVQRSNKKEFEKRLATQDSILRSIQTSTSTLVEKLEENLIIEIDSIKTLNMENQQLKQKLDSLIKIPKSCN